MAGLKLKFKQSANYCSTRDLFAIWDTVMLKGSKHNSHSHYLPRLFTMQLYASGPTSKLAC